MSNSLSRTEFLNELDDSIHVICPRGHGLSSFRLYEAIARGCLPVIVSDGWIAPNNIHWDSFCTFVREADIEQIPNRLNYSETETSMRQAALKHAYLTYLAPYVRMNYFLQEISSVPYGDCMAVSNAAKHYNINLNIRQKVVSVKQFVTGHRFPQ